MSVWRGVRPHLEGLARVKQCGERLSQLGAFHGAVLADEQLLEEALVDLPADRVGRREVSHLAAAGCLESDGEGGVDITVGSLGGSDLGVGFGQFAGEPVHLGGEQVLGDGPGVVGLEQLLAFVLGLLLALERPLHAAFGFVLLDVEFVADGGADLLGVVWPHLEGGVIGRDAIFDPLQAHGRTGAVVALGLLLDAHEVLVGAASAGVLGKDQSPAAAGAVDGAAQIVIVDPVLLAGVVMRGEYVLDGEPDVGLDESRMLAFVVNALVAHDTHVVGIGQDVVHRGSADRSGGPFRGRSAGEALGLGGQGEVEGAPLSGGVLLEAPADDFRPLRVQFDPGAFDAKRGLATIEISDRCAKWRAALLGLTEQSFHNFLGKVAGVELRDLGKQAVEQFSLWCLVDVLRAGDEFNAVLAEHEIDRDVVFPVAGKAVDLVDDDVVRLYRLDILEHLLKLVTVGRACRLASIDILVLDDGLKLGSLLVTAIALRRDGVTFRAPAYPRLLLRANTKVAESNRDRPARPTVWPFPGTTCRT